MSNKQIFLGFVLLFLIFAIGTASASTITVGPTGDFTTIQAAVNSANNGDKILVFPGTYIENVNVNKEVTITSQSENPGDTIVKAANTVYHVFQVSANNVTIDGFNITGATDYSRAGICLYSLYGNEGCTIDNNILSNNDFGIELFSSNNNTMTNNKAENNIYDGIYLYSSNNNTLTSNDAEYNNYGISLWRSSNNTLTSNKAENNNYDGIMLNPSCNNNTLTNNTADNNNRNGIYLYSSSNNTLTSNKAEYNNYGIRLSSASNNLICNNYFNNTDNIYISESNNCWNITKTAGTNIVGGPYLGGNFWATPDGTGFSQTHADSDADGICDESYVMSSENIDHLPLAYPTTTPADWNPWNDPSSQEGEKISLLELQTAIYDWRFGIVLSTGEMVDLSRLQGLIYSWRFG